MELQFQNRSLDCLRSILCETKSQEQTQEVKLPEAMPDVAKVLGAWGQCVLRSKEWHGGRMGISGGVMVWVLYAPEDGSFPRVVEAWLPYQLQWDLPQTQRDGNILVQPVLKRVDARVTSARKLMVRSCVEALGEALEPAQLEVFQPEQVPEGLYLRQQKYPVCLPSEAGEKTFQLEEELMLPPDCADGTKLIHYSLHPQIQEQRIVGNRLLLRGTALLRGLCRAEDDSLRSFSYEIPVSAYAELACEADENAMVQTVPVVTDLEVDLIGEGKLRLKASAVGQYLLCRRELLEIVVDAYRPGAKVQLQLQPILVPAVLESEKQKLRAEASREMPVGEIVDISFQAGQPELIRGGDETQLQLSGVFQILYRDEEMALQSAVVPWNQTQQLPADSSTKLCVGATVLGNPESSRSGNGVQLYGELCLSRKAVCASELPAVCALEITDTPAAAARPSLILRRPGGETLWDIAKACGSTEAAICQANDLTGEPDPERILLIPLI